MLRIFNCGIVALGVMVTAIGLIAAEPSGANPGNKPEKLTSKLLANPIRLSQRVLSGGLPEGEEAFRELRDLGVKTVISVDGARPDVETARRLGLRYVHLPHGYDGISESRVLELAKAVRDLDGTVYIHCHHGKHRSPAAAAAACVALGEISPANGLLTLEIAGTSTNYRGLYQTVRETQPVGKNRLDAFMAEFAETVAVPPIAEAMVALEHTHDHLKKIAAAGWKSPPDHPDLEPAHEALLLKEHYTEMLRTVEVQKQPAEYLELLRASEKAAEELETGLMAKRVNGEHMTKVLDVVNQSCKSCHQTFRDVPLKEKAKGKTPK